MFVFKDGRATNLNLVETITLDKTLDGTWFIAFDFPESSRFKWYYESKGEAEFAFSKLMQVIKAGNCDSLKEG